MQKRLEQLLNRLLLFLLCFDFSMNGRKNRSYTLLKRESGKSGYLKRKNFLCFSRKPDISPEKERITQEFNGLKSV
jgi:hypothetical protein